MSFHDSKHFQGLRRCSMQAEFATSHAFFARNVRTRNKYKCELIFGYRTIIFDINDSCNFVKAKVTYHIFQRRYVTYESLS